jgi:hypothetical protein
VPDDGTHSSTSGNTKPVRQNSRITKRRRVLERRWAIGGAVLVLAIVTTGPPWWWSYLRFNSPPIDSPVVGFSGGCATHQIYAVNRPSDGAVTRAGPNPMATEVTSLPPNASIDVDGWAYGKAASPTDGVTQTEMMIWFHVADESGWVSFTTVREYPTGLDPSGADPPQVHAVVSAACEGSPVT